MTKALEAAVLTQKNATNKKVALLYELYLDSGTLRYAAYITNIVFPTGGNTYYAKAINLTGATQAIEGQINRITANFDNITSDMAAYAYAEPFKNKKLIIKRVYLDALGSADNYEEVFNGLMETPGDIDYQTMSITATGGKPLNRRALSTPYQRMCPWQPGGDECNTDSNFDLTSLTASGTADSGSATTLTDNALTEADDYWNFGDIYITKSSITYKRKVKDFDAASDTITLDVGLDFSVDNTCTYTVYKGCDKTWDTCQANNAWGPSADNKLNFGGCIHIARKQDSSGDPFILPIFARLIANVINSRKR